jgi:hypothetical protein
MTAGTEKILVFLNHSRVKNIRERIGKILFSLAILLSLWAAATAGRVAFAQTEAPEELEEYRVKAAFLYNFAKFADWPNGSFTDNHSPFVLGIVGKDPSGKAFDSLNGKLVGNRELVVRRFSGLEALGRCHMLFVSASEQAHLAKILKKVEPWQVLTVSDMNGFCGGGGIIALFMEEKQIRFEINTDAAQRNGLRLSSQLLKLARIFREN